jgi:hypothetical protein
MTDAAWLEAGYTKLQTLHDSLLRNCDPDFHGWGVLEKPIQELAQKGAADMLT